MGSDWAKVRQVEKLFDVTRGEIDPPQIYQHHLTIPNVFFLLRNTTTGVPSLKLGVTCGMVVNYEVTTAQQQEGPVGVNIG